MSISHQHFFSHVLLCLPFKSVCSQCECHTLHILLVVFSIGYLPGAMPDLWLCIQLSIMWAWCFHFCIFAELLSNFLQHALHSSHSVTFACACSDGIHCVHIRLVYLCLLKEPIFHKTSAGIPITIGFCLLWDFSVSLITNGLALHPFVMI